MKQIFKTEAEWLNAKATRYGGSEAAAIFGLNPFKSPRDVWMDKKGLSQPIEKSFRMKAGNYLEAGVARLWADDAGFTLIESTTKKGIGSEPIEYWIHDEYDFIGGSPDARFWLDDGRTQNNKGVLEIKTTGAMFDHDNYPDSWDIQIMTYLGLMGYKKGIIAWFEFKSYELKWIEIDFDQEMYDSIIQKLVEFHNTYIVNDIEPPLMNTRDLLDKYPSHKEGKRMDASSINGIEELYTNIISLQEKVKPAIEMIDKLKDEVKMIMGDAESIIANEIPLFTFKTSKDKEVLDVKKLQEEAPDIYNAYLITKPGSRRFLVKN